MIILVNVILSGVFFFLLEIWYINKVVIVLLINVNRRELICKFFGKKIVVVIRKKYVLEWIFIVLDLVSGFFVNVCKIIFDVVRVFLVKMVIIVLGNWSIIKVWCFSDWFGEIRVLIIIL